MDPLKSIWGIRLNKYTEVYQSHTNGFGPSHPCWLRGPDADLLVKKFQLGPQQKSLCCHGSHPLEHPCGEIHPHPLSLPKRLEDLALLTGLEPQCGYPSPEMVNGLR